MGTRQDVGDHPDVLDQMDILRVGIDAREIPAVSFHEPILNGLFA
jgi:hypothetical protein